MALISLGSLDVSTPYQWVSYTPVELNRSSIYALYVTVKSSSFAQVYSTFALRLRGDTEEAISCVSEPFALIEAIPDTQVIKLTIEQYWDTRKSLIIECRRNFFYSQPSSLADSTVELEIDPGQNYKL